MDETYKARMDIVFYDNAPALYVVEPFVVWTKAMAGRKGLAFFVSIDLCSRVLFMVFTYIGNALAKNPFPEYQTNWSASYYFSNCSYLFDFTNVDHTFLCL